MKRQTKNSNLPLSTQIKNNFNMVCNSFIYDSSNTDQLIQQLAFAVHPRHLLYLEGNEKIFQLLL